MFLYFRPNGDEFAIGLCKPENDDQNYSDIIFASEMPQELSGITDRMLGLMEKYPSASNVFGMDKDDMETMNNIGKLCCTMIRSPMPVYRDRLPDQYQAALDRLTDECKFQHGIGHA